MSVPRQGELWWAHAAGKRRPVLVVTRSEVTGLLDGIVVAPVTRTIRGMPTGVRLGPDEGLRTDCVASFDNLQRVLRAALRTRIGELGPRHDEICEALKAFADC